MAVRSGRPEHLRPDPGLPARRAVGRRLGVRPGAGGGGAGGGGHVPSNAGNDRQVDADWGEEQARYSNLSFTLCLLAQQLFPSKSSQSKRGNKKLRVVVLLYEESFLLLSPDSAPPSSAAPRLGPSSPSPPAGSSPPGWAGSGSSTPQGQWGAHGSRLGRHSYTTRQGSTHAYLRWGFNLEMWRTPPLVEVEATTTATAVTKSYSRSSSNNNNNNNNNRYDSSSSNNTNSNIPYSKKHKHECLTTVAASIWQKYEYFLKISPPP